MDYGSPYGNNFWYKSSSSSWTDMSGNGNSAGLTVSVSALNNPSGQSATTQSGTQINLGWTRGTSGTAKNTVIFRSTSSTAPTPAGGTAYSAGNNYTLGGISYRCIYNGSGTSTSDSGLSNGTTYYYYFFAVNNSYYSPGVSANATTWTTPGAPTITGITPGNGQLSVAFTAPASDGGTDITNYEYSTNNGSTWTARSPAATGSPIVITGLNNGTEYTVRIRAVNAVGAGAQSGSQTGTPRTTPTLAATPTSANVETTTATLGGNVTATGGADITERGIYWSTINNFTPPGQGTKDSQTGTFGTGAFTRDVTGLPSGSTIYFRSFAVNAAGTVYSSNQGSILTKPAAPSTPTASAVGTTGFTANWGAVTGADNYRLDVATDSGFSSMVAGYNNLLVSSGTSQAISGLTPGRTYYVRVRAVNTSGTSGNSGTLTQATDCWTTGPTIQAATSVGIDEFTANWSALTGATSYRLDVSTSETFGGGGVADVFDEVETMGAVDVSANTPIATHEANDGFANTNLTMSGTGDIRTTGASSGYVGASGGNNVWLSSAGNDKTFIISGIDSTGFSDMKLYFGILKTTLAEDGSNMSIEASTNGTDWVSCGAVSLPTGSGTAVWHYRTNSVPDSMAGPNLRIRFFNLGAGASFRIDDVMLVGEKAEPAFVDGYENRNVGDVMSAVVTGLTANTEYFYRVRAVNDYCTSPNSGTEDVVTHALVPAAPTVDNPGPNSLDVTVNAGGNPADVEFAIREVDGDRYVQADGTLGASEVWQTAADWDTISVVGLSFSTEYTFAVKARNSDEVETAFGPTASETTLAGPLARWSFEDVVSASEVADDVTASDVTISSTSISFQNGTDDGGTRIGNASSWNQDAFSASGKYLQFSIEPDSGYMIDLEELTVRLGRTSTGPTLATVQYSLDGFDTAGTTAASDLAVTSTDTGALDAHTIDTMPSGPQTNTVTFRLWGHDATGTGNLRFNNFRIFGSVHEVPEITVTGALADFGQVADGGTSSEQTYTVSGVRLRDDLVVTAPTGFQVSKSSGSGFGASISFEPDGSGTLGSSTVYVRFAPGSAGPYEDDITHTSPLAVTKLQPVEGTGVGLATVTTLEPYDITITSAKGGGNVTDAGHGTVSSRGIYWGTSANPTSADNTASGGSGTGPFDDLDMTGLTPGQTYHVRAFAINQAGTAYGANETFQAACWAVGPTIGAPSAIGTSGFTANWSALTGATGYRLDVWTPGAAGQLAYHDGTLGAAGWTETDVAQGHAAGNDYVQMLQASSVLVSPAMDFRAGTDQELTFEARTFGGVSGDSAQITVSISRNNGSTWTVLGTRTPSSTTLTAMDPFDISAYYGEQVRIRLQTLSAGGSQGVGVDNIEVTHTAANFVTDFENREVSGGGTESEPVTGLDPETTYYYRVRGVNAHCTSPNSDTESVSLPAAEPTTQASDLVLLSRDKSSIEIEWTNGSGDNRIVVVTEYDAAGLWLFDEGAGATAHDSTVHGNDGSLFNNPTWSTRGGAGAMSFARASTQYVQVLDALSLKTTNSQTISFWINPVDFPGRQNPWAKAYGGEGTITLETGSHFNYYWGHAGANTTPYQGVNSISGLTAGQWTHVVLVRDLDDVHNRRVRWYFDGVEVRDVAATYTNAVASTLNLTFGTGYAGSLNGSMSEPMLLDRALSAAEVEALFEMGSMGLGWEPTDGVAPSGENSDFSLAADQGFNSKIVYNGSGNSVEVTGLKANTAYRFRVFEYNGSGAAVNYNTDTATDNPKTFATLDYEPPTEQASGLSVVGFGTTTLNLEWNRGNGDNVLIVGKEGDPADDPMDDESYTVSSNWGTAAGHPVPAGGDSRGLYNFTGTTLDVTALSPETLYHFAAYEYLDHGGNERYLRTDVPRVSRWTLSAEPSAHVTGFAAGNETSSSIDLSWTAAAGPPSGYMILRRVGANPDPNDVPEDGWGYTVGHTFGDSTVVAIITDGSATGRTITGLSPETTYHFSIIPFNWNGTSAETYNYRTAPTIPTAHETTTEKLEIKDHFEGTVGHNLNNMGGGTGWTDNWSVSGDQVLQIQEHSRAIPDGYPESAGNHVRTQNRLENNQETYAIRHFDPFSVGRIYASAILSYEYNSPGAFMGLAFVDDDTELAFAGRPSQDEELLGLDSFGAARQMSSQIFWGFHEYAVIMMYDFSTRELRAMIYPSDVGEIPAEEPGYWHISVTVPEGHISQVDGIKIVGGAPDDNDIGHIWFDEVRVADTWRGLLDLDFSDPTEPPTSQASQLTYNSERKNQFRVNWVRGNGTRVLVVAREGSEIPESGFPVDGNTYTANAAFGTIGTEIGTGNFVVYNGDLDEVTITGLDPSTTYHIRAFEFNDGAGTKYLTTEAPGNPAAFATLTPPVPTVGLAGTTAVDLSWSKFNNRDVMVVFRVGSPVTFTPTDGTPYSAGAQGSDTILLADSSDTFYQHTGRTEDTTVYYRFFSRNGNYYSEGVDRHIIMTETTIIFEPFEYGATWENLWNLDTLNGGTGWGGGWSTPGGTSSRVVPDNFSEGNRSIPYPSYQRARLYAGSGGGVQAAHRMFNENFTTGVVYISWMMLYQHHWDNMFCGIHLMTDWRGSGGDDTAFIGKVQGVDAFGIDWYGASQATSAVHTAHSTEYFCVLRYDFDTRELSANIYPANRIVAEEMSGTTSDLDEFESYWDVTVTVPVDQIPNIRGIEIKGGSSDGELGYSWFDEIRAGRDWYAVTRRDGLTHAQMMDAGPVPELIFIGADYDPDNPPPVRTFVYDAEIADTENLIDFAVRWSSPHGVFLTNIPTKDTISSGVGNVTPNWDPMVRVGEDFKSIGYDVMFSGFIGENGATVVTTYHVNAFSSEDFGEDWDVDNDFFITVSGQTFPDGDTVSAEDGMDVPVRRAVTVNYPLQFTIVDDDTDPPSLRGFERELTDADMRAGFWFTGMVRDAQSGVLSDSNLFTLVNPAGTVIEGPQELFDTRPEDGEARTDFGALAHFIEDVGFENNMLGAWTATVWAADADDDRPNDSAWTNRQFIITVVDDDTEPPTLGPAPFRVVLGEETITADMSRTNLIAGWNFNDTDNLLTVSHGSGTLTHNFAAITNFKGTVLNRYRTDPAGQALAIQGGSGLVNNGEWFQFELDMSGHQNLIMTYAVQKTMEGFTDNQVSWSTDGSNFTPFGEPFNPHGTNVFSIRTNDFSSIEALNNRESVYIRFTLDEATGALGNNRYDNFQFRAQSAAVELTDAQLASVSGTNLLHFHFQVYDDQSGVARGTDADNRNMRVYVDGWLAGNVANYDAGRSDPDTTLSTTESVWTWDGFTREQITGMVGDEMNPSNRAVRITAGDLDDDRPNDTSWMSNQLVGIVRFIDDDIIPPRVGDDGLALFLGEEEIEPVSEWGDVGQTNLIAAWNFNDSDNPFAVSHGFGTATIHPEWPDARIRSFAGDNNNLVEGDIAGNDLGLEVGLNRQNEGLWMQYEIDMSRHRDLEMSFAIRRTAAGFASNRVEYSVNGGAFETYIELWDPPTTYSLETWDFSDIEEINGAASVIIRITFIGVSSDASSPNNRFDNVQFNAVEAAEVYYYEITDGDLASVSAQNPLWFSFNVYDTESGIHRGTTDNGLNMQVTVEELMTDDTSRFQAPPVSMEDTRDPASTSVWRYAEAIAYEDIGAMYGDGETDRDIRATFADMDDDRINDELWVSNRLFGVYRVIDDDEDPPYLVSRGMNGLAARSFWVLTHGVPLPPERRTGTGTNTTWTVTDGELANPTEHGLQFMFIMQDEGSGISRHDEWWRTASDSNTVINFSIGELGDLLYGPNWDLDLGASSANLTNAPVTNVWTFAAGAFGYPPSEQVGELYDADTSSVLITLVDDDDDRPNDQAIEYLVRTGYLEVIDDDTDPPLMHPLSLEGEQHNLFLMNFDAFTGWTNTLGQEGQYMERINHVPDSDDVWVGENFGVTLIPSTSGETWKMSGRRVGAFQTGQSHGRLEMPEREELGNLFVWAILSSAGDPRSMVVEGTTNGVDWTYNFGTNVVSENLEYELLSWDIDHPGPMTLRLRPGDANPRAIYFDDIALTRRGGWTNAVEINVTFDNAYDESGIYAYRALTEDIPDFHRGTNIAQEGYVQLATNTAAFEVPEGVVTGFIYAVDADMDRPNDQLRNAGIPYVARIDRTPPIAVDNLKSTSAAEDKFYHFDEIDITTEIGLKWDAFATEAEAAGPRASDQMHLSPWDTFIITYVQSDVIGNPLPDAPTLTVTRASSGHTNLHNWAETNAVLTDLDFDAYYLIEVRGRDEAGNIGPMASTIGNTERFSLTQGVTRARSHVQLYWDFSPGRPYDLISADAPGFTMATTGKWEWVGTVYSHTLEDERSLEPGNLRFYRAAHHNRWKADRPRRLASEEVYVRKDYQLHPGENWIQFPGIPDTNTVRYIFGTDLPAGALHTEATVIRWWDRGPNPVDKTNELWLAYLGGGEYGWRRDNEPADDERVPLDQGVEILIRGNDPQMYTFIGRVPTNTMTQTIKGGGSSDMQSGAVNLVQIGVPNPMHPSNLNLTASGFSGGTQSFHHGDWLMTWNPETQSVNMPMTYDSNNNIWRYIGPGWPPPPVTGNVLQPGDAIMIWRREGRGDFTWTNAIPYPPPNRWIDP